MFKSYKSGNRYRPSRPGFGYSEEFDYYLHVITQAMDCHGSFLELGPGSFSLSDYIKNVTILDNNPRVLERYKKSGRILGDYHKLAVLPNSFDYVVAIHPELSDSERNIDWLGNDEARFRFKVRGLEDFVSSLIDIARKSVFVVSKTIVDNLPLQEFAARVVAQPYHFVLYEKQQGGIENGEFKPVSHCPDAV